MHTLRQWAGFPSVNVVLQLPETSDSLPNVAIENHRTVADGIY